MTTVIITFIKDGDPYEITAKKRLEPGFEENELASSSVRLIKERVK